MSMGGLLSSCIFFNFFLQRLKFLLYKSFTSLVRFVPSYFMESEEIMNESVFLVSFMVRLLLVCKKATDFCVLILYPGNLLNVMNVSIRFRSFLVKSLGSFM